MRATSPSERRKSTPRSPTGSSRLSSSRGSGHIVKNARPTWAPRRKQKSASTAHSGNKIARTNPRMCSVSADSARPGGSQCAATYARALRIGTQRYSDASRLGQSEGSPGYRPRWAPRKLGDVPHVENVVYAALAQPTRTRRVFPPSRAVRNPVPAVEGPWEGHQADVGHDAIVVAVPTEEVQERNVVLRVTLAPNVQQLADGCGGCPARHVTSARLPSAGAILLPHGTAPGRSLDRVRRRNGLEPRRVEQAATDVFLDRYRRLATGSASARTPVSVVHQGPRQKRPHGIHTLPKTGRRAGSDEGPAERECRPSPGMPRGLNNRRHRRRPAAQAPSPPHLHQPLGSPCPRRAAAKWGAAGALRGAPECSITADY